MLSDNIKIDNIDDEDCILYDTKRNTITKPSMTTAVLIFFWDERNKITKHTVVASHIRRNGGFDNVN